MIGRAAIASSINNQAGGGINKAALLTEIEALANANWIIDGAESYKTWVGGGSPPTNQAVDGESVTGGIKSKGNAVPQNGSAQDLHWEYKGSDYSTLRLFYAQYSAPVYRDFGNFMRGLHFTNGEASNYETNPSNFSSAVDIVDFAFTWTPFRGARSEAIWNSGVTGFMLKNAINDSTIEFDCQGLTGTVQSSAGVFAKELGRVYKFRIQILANGDFKVWMTDIKDGDTPIISGNASGWTGMHDQTLGTNAHVASGLYHHGIMSLGQVFSSAEQDTIVANYDLIWPPAQDPSWPYYRAQIPSLTLGFTDFDQDTHKWTPGNRGTFVGGSGTEHPSGPFARWWFHSSVSEWNTLLSNANHLDNHVQIGGQIVLTGGSGGDTLDTLTADGVSLISGAASFNSDLATTADDIASNINAHSSGWKAVSISGRNGVCLVPPANYPITSVCAIAASATGITFTTQDGAKDPNELDRDLYIEWFFNEGASNTEDPAYSFVPRDDQGNLGFEEMGRWGVDNIEGN